MLVLVVEVLFLFLVVLLRQRGLGLELGLADGVLGLRRVLETTCLRLAGRGSGVRRLVPRDVGLTEVDLLRLVAQRV